MKLIKAIKQVGAKRLHRRYRLENKDNFMPSFKYDAVDDSTIEFESKFENALLDEVAVFSLSQKERLSKELRLVNITNVQDATHEQGTKEWLQSRAGIITASKTPFSVDGKKIPTYSQYVSEKVAEAFRVKHGGEEVEKVNSVAMQRGHDLEPFAIERYETLTGNKVVLKGLVTSKDKMIGASPDGMTSDEDFNTINVEIKSVLLQNYIGELTEHKVSKHYRTQLQVQMYILNVDVTHMLIQCQDVLDTELKLIVREVHRDEEFISNMIETVKCFEDDFNERMAALEKMIA